MDILDYDKIYKTLKAQEFINTRSAFSKNFLGYSARYFETLKTAHSKGKDVSVNIAGIMTLMTMLAKAMGPTKGYQLAQLEEILVRVSDDLDARMAERIKYAEEN